MTSSALHVAVGGRVNHGKAGFLKKGPSSLSSSLKSSSM